MRNDKSSYAQVVENKRKGERNQTSIRRNHNGGKRIIGSNTKEVKLRFTHLAYMVGGGKAREIQKGMH